MNQDFQIQLLHPTNFYISKYGEFADLNFFISSGTSQIYFQNSFADLVLNKFSHGNSFKLPFLVLAPFQNQKFKIQFEIKQNQKELSNTFKIYKKEILNFARENFKSESSIVLFRNYIFKKSEEFELELMKYLIIPANASLNLRLNYMIKNKNYSSSFFFDKLEINNFDLSSQIQNFFGKISIDTISNTDSSISTGVGSSLVIF